VKARPRCLTGSPPGWLAPRLLRRAAHGLGPRGSTNRIEARIACDSRTLQPTMAGILSALTQVIAPPVLIHSTQRRIVMERLQPLRRPSWRTRAGIDVRRMLHVVPVLIELPDGTSHPLASLAIRCSVMPWRTSRCCLHTSTPALGRCSRFATPPCGCMFIIDNCSGYAVG
jgi:hypothetical protein